ncbi:MAG: serine hydrolase [Candidatus Latescibacteria bacterium]|nr:serine hydrolase [Candidatus Latescibacterota bacterium]
MRISKRKIIWTILFLTGILVVLGDYYLIKRVPIATGVRAKTLCSGVFVSNQNPEILLRQNLRRFVNFVHLEINIENKTASAKAFGLFKRRAIFREGLGATLLVDLTDEELRSQPVGDLTPESIYQKSLPWPAGDSISDEGFPSNLDRQKLNDIVDREIQKTDSEKYGQTKALVVVYEGRIIAERYARGFEHNTPLPGYGMTKSVINALVGILVYSGKLTIDEPAPVPEWEKPNDPRNAITIDQLLRMSSGLEAESFNDMKFMLYGCGDMAAYAANKHIEAEPDTKWSYSNGTTLILSRILRGSLGGTQTDYFSFPRSALFDLLGMHSAIIEPDESGTFVGSTFMYASARDWARFGLLFLNDGVWENERILPEGWVRYSRTPTMTKSRADYGAHFWTNAENNEGNRVRKFPNLPPDAFFALGHHGQSLTVIPSRKLVVVYLAMDKSREMWNVNTFVADILEAIQ